MPEPKKPPLKPAEAAFDRQEYLKEVRRNILKNLGLPEDTRPDQVMRLLEIQEARRLKN